MPDEFLLRDRSTRSRKTLIILAISLGFFIISTITLAVLFAREKIINLREDLCSTPYCIKAADYLLDSIDESVNPCDDFYQFSCGKWLEHNRIPDDANAQNTFRILDRYLSENIVDLLSETPENETAELNCVTNARRLYSSCVDETQIDNEGIKPILSIIQNEFGGWPILEGASWNPSTFNISNVLLKLRQYNYVVIYNINTDIDEKNSSLTDVIIGQGTLGLPQRQYYENETNTTVAYRDFIQNLAKALANDSSMIEQDVRDIYAFEKQIAHHFWTSDERRARDNETVRTTVADLSKTFSTSFDFTKHLRNVYETADVILQDEETVAVSELDFLTNASSIIDATPARTLQNYFVWRFLMDQSANMPRSIRSIREQFERVFLGTNAEQPRTTTCGVYVNNNMGMVVSKLYIKSYFDENARSQSLNMIENIRNSFIDMLQKSTWMDSDSKTEAAAKAHAISQQIGYPDYLGSDNNTRIEQDFKAYEFDSSYIHNILKMQKIKASESFLQLEKPVDHTAWGPLPPTIINAFYEPPLNQITFPAGILQMPFFNKDAPKYLNYGGIGMVIGHEITHGFDDVGRQFDKDGNRRPWWSQSTIDNFNTQKQCIIDQYSNYSVAHLHMNSNGNQTQGEDIADNGGIKAAYFAYQKWANENPDTDKNLPGLTKYTPEQLFFINFAHTWCIKMTDAYAINRLLTDPHSLGQFRVIGPTSNFDKFDDAFSCHPGQKNSREHKCTVW